VKSTKTKNKLKKPSCKDKIEVVLKEVENLTKEAKDFFHLIEDNERKKDGTK